MKYLYILRGFIISFLLHDMEYWDSNPNKEQGPVFWRRYLLGSTHAWYGNVDRSFELKLFDYEYVGRWFVDSSHELWEH